MSGPSLHRRLGGLAICLAAGSLIGWTGQVFTGSAAWWLALPGLLALAWLFVADPTRCDPATRKAPPR